MEASKNRISVTPEPKGKNKCKSFFERTAYFDLLYCNVIFPALLFPQIPLYRDWKFKFSGAPPVNKTTMNSRAMNIQWTLNDARPQDAGIYSCKVHFLEQKLTSYDYVIGEQVIRGKASLTARSLWLFLVIIKVGAGSENVASFI